MIQTFTTQFHFKNKHYSALTTLHARKKDAVTFRVQVTDEELFTIIPGGRLIFDISEGLQVPSSPLDSAAEELITCITDAISEHINKIDLSLIA